MPQLDAGIGCGGLGFFAACGAQALASLMDFETELGFYMVSFILICFRLPRLKITASLWQTNAPAAKISRLAPAIAHRAPARYQDVSFFFFSKKSFHRRRQSGNRKVHWLCLPHRHTSSPPRRTVYTQRTHTRLLLPLWQGRKGGGDGALWQRTVMSIHRAFYHPLIQRSGFTCRHEAQGPEDVW